MKKLFTASILVGLIAVTSAGPASRPARKQESGSAAKGLGVLDSETAVLDGAIRPAFSKQESGR